MKTAVYMISSGLILLLSGVVLLFADGAAATAWANGNHNSFSDAVFPVMTKAGEWPVILLILTMALYRHWKQGLWMSACFIIEAVINNGLKWLLNAPRPIQELGDSLHRIPGVDIHHWQSFPSGHTAAAFTAFGLLSHMLTKPWQQLLCALTAALVGYSRLYLGQHYLRDVAGGICVGMLVILIYDLGEKKWGFHLKKA